MAKKQKSQRRGTGEARQFSPMVVAAGGFSHQSDDQLLDLGDIKEGRRHPSRMVETNLGGILLDIPGFDRARVLAGPLGAMGMGSERGYVDSMYASGKPRLELSFNEGSRWTRIQDATSTPWRAICHLEIQFRSNRATGTGWFIDQHTIITAGHNLLHPDLGWSEGALIRPGRNVGGQGLSIAVPASEGDVHPAWKANPGNAIAHDIGYLKVKDPSIGNFVGNFGLRVMTNQELAHGELIVHSAGYPTISSPGSLWADASRIRGFSDEFIFYRLDTAEGNSGAPIFAKFHDGQCLVVACHSHGTADGQSNAGVRIVDDIFDYIVSCMG